MSTLEGADRWLGKVRDWFYDKTGAVGIDAWNRDPRLRVTRERSVRLLVLAAKKRDRAAGIPARPVTRAHDRARTRI
jgi:hypothetical protein